MRKLIYYVACTADGFIAAADGSFDAFLNEGEHLTDLVAEFPETLPVHLREAFGVQGKPNRVFDTVLMGRATYEVGLKYGITSPYSHLRQYVFSSVIKPRIDVDVIVVAKHAVKVVRDLKESSGAHIWLCGGGQLAAALFEEIDEFIFKVNPSLIGAGIPLFARRVPQTRLRLSESKHYANGASVLRYEPLRKT